MAALRSFAPEPLVADEMLAQQRERIRVGQCVFCGVSWALCTCGEYERTDDRRDYASDDVGVD